jgi:RNA polymerase sigma-70 factor (ECF subfamily)
LVLPSKKGLDENHLIRAAKRGEAAAEQRLHDLCAKALAEYVARRSGAALRRHVSLSDLCQESFLRAFRAIGSLRDDATLDDFRALLFQHASWVASEKGRQAQDYKGESALEQRLEEALVAARSPASKGTVTREDERRWLESFVARLDPGQAAVIRLRLDGLSFVQIGERLSLDKDAARKRYLRGITRLRLLIRRDGGGAGSP